ncbi:MAG: phosphomannomutase/phosphoglucomutase [Candidatus Pacebacteria bacterium]|jgi:phosphomannomutase/phosphoglucomutase|nr:phosphomannomutase/phosphoglucomutase [Candidatus Paceibacterota bacterium]
MAIKDNIFRGYDIRGTYPDELNENAVYYATKAFCELYPHMKRVIIARDPRLSSPALAEAATKAFLEHGKEVADLDIAPDPLWYFSIFHYGYDGGLMITGSHNPPEHNGLTYHARQTADVASEELMGEALQELRRHAQKLEAEGKTGVPSGKAIKLDPSDEYIEYVASKIKIDRPLKIVLDTGNGACGYLPERLFKRLGCEAMTVNGEFDGTFPNHLPDPYLPETRKFLGEKVLEAGADMGFAYDTDGDRVAISDSRGRSANGDDTLLILAREAVARKKGTVVHCMRASKAFIDDMKQMGATPMFSVSHHNAIRANVKKHSAVFGGEITFHYAFPLDYYLVDDAVFASAKLAQVAAGHDDFAAYVDSLPHYCASPELNVACADDVKFGVIENLQKYLRDNSYDFIDVDGARINFADGWALARCSNTAPVIKCKFEGDTPEALKDIEQKSLKIFNDCGVPITGKDYKFLGL